MALAELIPWQDAASAFPQFVERDGRAQTAMQRALTERASLAKLHRAASRSDYRRSGEMDTSRVGRCRLFIRCRALRGRNSDC